MAGNNGPKIVRSGLQLHLDAADRKSYPGSGTTWFDLSGNSRHGTLLNGPVFNSGNGGYISFDGVDDYVNIPNATNLNNLGSQDFTVSMWVYRATNPPSGNGEMLYQSATLDNGFVKL